ncbi:MAG: tRNA-dependent cyclodipeptide synthase [Nostoc sp. TH1S01]|nr:tRNA-dependent cyclodipeptide synthase [Nostoc sp. TH1S01]
MSIQKLQEFLNSHQLKYQTIFYSPAYTAEELNRYKQALGLELIEAIVVEIDKQKIAIVLLSASVKINVDSLQKALDANSIKLLNQKEFEHLFPDCEFGTLPPYGGFYDMDVFWSHDLSENKNVAYYAYSYAHLVKMKYIDFEKLLNFQNKLAFLTRAKYRVEIEAIIPKLTRQELDIHEDCFLGVSLENENFSIPKLVGITDWISKHFKKCTVLIGDSIHRITLQINQDLNESHAFSKAIILGREYIDNATNIFVKYTEKCHFDVIFCSDIQESEEYFKYYEQLHIFMKKNEKFANSIKSSAQEFVLRQFDKNIENFERYVELSSGYLLEELAIFACLVKYGLSIMVYPGSLDMLEGIAEGCYPGIPDYLQQIIYVSLRLKGR